jgi:hypothetical protein
MTINNVCCAWKWPDVRCALSAFWPSALSALTSLLFLALFALAPFNGIFDFGLELALFGGIKAL